MRARSGFRGEFVSMEPVHESGQGRVDPIPLVRFART